MRRYSRVVLRKFGFSHHPSTGDIMLECLSFPYWEYFMREGGYVVLRNFDFQCRPSTGDMNRLSLINNRLEVVAHIFVLGRCQLLDALFAELAFQ